MRPRLVVLRESEWSEKANLIRTPKTYDSSVIHDRIEVSTTSEQTVPSKQVVFPGSKCRELHDT
eukprot:CAMPEP_0184678946 /NCGR_PEP_ID=MMETSP0312-20130426/1766_1 /TAXON_ID=31354 /ORGANISM="Compsopogon coeruleus, Strain SAG 36.94" /LENGTH=63 /DNA_ID=CAMNT_0027128069 /DNA_START=434 /DNA_END=625 /DNA_ORIENTATION=+